MNARNPAMLARGRAHGVELSPEAEAECKAAEAEAVAAATDLAPAEAEVKRIRAELATAEAKAKSLRESVKPLREKAKLLRLAHVNVSVREAKRVRDEAERASLEKKLADCIARLAAPRAA